MDEKFQFNLWRCRWLSLGEFWWFVRLFQVFCEFFSDFVSFEALVVLENSMLFLPSIHVKDAI